MAWLVAVVCGVVASVGAGVGCEQKPKARAPGPLRVVVTLPPLKSFVTPLTTPGTEVTVLMAPGRSEHGYEFGPEDLATLGRADVVVMVGMMLEPKVEQFLADHPDPARQVVDFGKCVGVSAMKDADHDGHGHEGHDHGGHDHAAHGEGDPHLWLDPVLVTQLVPAIRSAVQTAEKALGSDRTAALQAAEAELLSRVLAVDDAYREKLGPSKGKGIVTHHAAWGRLAERYGLRVAEVLRPVESVEPDAAHTAAVVEALKASGTGVLFIEPAYDRRSAERIAAAAGARVVTMDPLGTGDWFAMMNANLAVMVGAFSTSSLPTPTPTPTPTPNPTPAPAR